RHRAVEEAAAVAEPVALAIEAHDGRDRHVGDHHPPLGRYRDVPHAAIELVAALPCTKLQRMRLLHHYRKCRDRAAFTQPGEQRLEIGLAAEWPVSADDQPGWITDQFLETVGDPLRQGRALLRPQGHTLFDQPLALGLTPVAQ